MSLSIPLVLAGGLTGAAVAKKKPKVKKVPHTTTVTYDKNPDGRYNGEVSGVLSASFPGCVKGAQVIIDSAGGSSANRIVGADGSWSMPAQPIAAQITLVPPGGKA